MVEETNGFIIGFGSATVLGFLLFGGVVPWRDPAEPDSQSRANPFGSPVLFHTAAIHLMTQAKPLARSRGNDRFQEALLHLDGGKLLVQSGYLLSALGGELDELVHGHWSILARLCATVYFDDRTNPVPGTPTNRRAPLRFWIRISCGCEGVGRAPVVNFSASDHYIAYSIEEGYFGNMSMRIQAFYGEGPHLSFAHGTAMATAQLFSLPARWWRPVVSELHLHRLQTQDVARESFRRPLGKNCEPLAPNRFAFELVDDHDDQPSTPLEVDVFDWTRARPSSR